MLKHKPQNNFNIILDFADKIKNTKYRLLILLSKITTPLSKLYRNMYMMKTEVTLKRSVALGNKFLLLKNAVEVL